MSVPRVEQHSGILVVRDDLYPGGTKARVLPAALVGVCTEYVYASPVYGFAQIALAYACMSAGKRAVIFCAKRGQRHPLTQRAMDAGAVVKEVPYGYLSVVQTEAKKYCHGYPSDRVFLPFGLDLPIISRGITALAQSLSISPKEVWTVAGSGTLTRALQAAWPTAEFHAVTIGAKCDTGRAIVHSAPERFKRQAKEPPPFPSCSNYDAKAWQFIRKMASRDALFWNVAA